MNVVKRDGQKVPFDTEKIISAIKRANESTDASSQLKDDEIAVVARRATDRINNLMTEEVTIEDIQEAIEYELMYESRVVARNYIKYAEKRDIARAIKKNKLETLSSIEGIVEVSNQDILTENANKNPVIASTQRDYMAGETSKWITEHILPEDIWKAHQDGVIHFHDSDYFGQHIHNCFTGGTKLVTDKGVVEFKNLHDGEIVFVKDLHGEIRRATVHKYEPQKMQKVFLKNGCMRHEVVCTPDHRWVLLDGSVTTNLKVGDKLYRLEDSTNIEPSNIEEIRAFCTGFAIGDGVDKENSTLVRLCGDKRKYKDLFLSAGYTIYHIKNSDDIVCRYNRAFKQDFLNGKGWRFMTPQTKAFAFRGYYAADGSKKANKVSTTDQRICLFIEETSGMAGFYISSKADEVRDTNYKSNSLLHSYHFVKKNNSNQVWKVEKIERFGHGLVDTWCVEEPITHTFTLEKGIVTGNCDLVNLEDMLQNGTVISETLIEKPHTFYTACNVTTQIVAQVASSQYGGQSFSLAHLAPFVQISREKFVKEVTEEMKENGILVTDEQIRAIAERRVRDEIGRGIQTIQYQLITLMTTNGQAPFVTMFIYLDEVPEGQTRDDLVLCAEEVFKQRIQGVKNEKGVFITPAFPKIIYALDEDNISEDSKYWNLTVLAAKCTAKRMVPDYISAKVMREQKLGNVYTCMGCRSFLTAEPTITNPDGSMKFYGRFNQGVVTLNLPDVACASMGDMDRFWEILNERLELCHRALRCRHERLLGTPSDTAPILWQHGALARLKKGETIDKLLYGGYSTISLGYSGLYECCVRMTGKSHTDPEAKPFALSVMQALNDACKKWREAENIAYSVYGTPMESTTYKFAKATRKRYGIIPEVTDHDYQTNSYHVCVRETIDAFSKLTIESEFQKLSPGGAISYVEVPNLQNNIPAVLSVMKHIYENIMYAELNTKSDYCQVCGFDGEILMVEDENKKLIWRCPQCGNTNHATMNIARRVCGYIGTNEFNQGRMGDVHDRVLHL